MSAFLLENHHEFVSRADSGHQLAVLTTRLIKLPPPISPVVVNFPTGSLEVFLEWRLRKVGAEGSSVGDPEVEGFTLNRSFKHIFF
jgi:hypothetical protein